MQSPGNDTRERKYKLVILMLIIQRVLVSGTKRKLLYPEANAWGKDTPVSKLPEAI